MQIHSTTPLIPDSFRSFEDWARGHHLDLGGLDTEQLSAELELVRRERSRRVFAQRGVAPHRQQRVYLGGADYMPVTAWLADRARHLANELRRRTRR